MGKSEVCQWSIIKLALSDLHEDPVNKAFNILQNKFNQENLTMGRG